MCGRPPRLSSEALGPILYDVVMRAILLFPVLVTAGVALALFGLARVGRRKRPAGRLIAILAEADKEDEEVITARRRRGERVLKFIFAVSGKLVGRFYGTRQYMDLEHSLDMAGRPHGWTAFDFIGMRVALGLGLGLGNLLFWSALGSTDMGLIVGLLAGTAGLIGPVFWLRSRVRSRKRQIEQDLPDVLDLLSLCLDAGMGLEAAIWSATRRWQGPLIDEFGESLAEIRLGWTRQDALRQMVYRSGVAQLSAFVAAMVQADQLGVSLRSTLHSQAIDARAAYRRQIQETGYRAPIKMIIPMTFFVLPAMFIVILGPVVPMIAGSVVGQP